MLFLVQAAQNKTQFFFSPKNDHICTRIEHVTHVESISYTIANYLGLNTELTKAEVLFRNGEYTKALTIAVDIIETIPTRRSDNIDCRRVQLRTANQIVMRRAQRR